MRILNPVKLQGAGYPVDPPTSPFSIQGQLLSHWSVASRLKTELVSWFRLSMCLLAVLGMNARRPSLSMLNMGATTELSPTLDSLRIFKTRSNEVSQEGLKLTLWSTKTLNL